MSEEQLTALLARLSEDAGLRKKLQGAADVEAAVEMAKEAGFDTTKEAWLRWEAQQRVELSDEELEGVTGGTYTAPVVTVIGTLIGMFTNIQTPGD